MTVYHPTFEHIFAWPARTGLRLRLDGQVMRGIVRVLWTLLLALIFFLSFVETVVALERW